MKRYKLICWVIVSIILSFNIAQAVELVEDGKIIIPDRTTEKIKIDGDLSEDIWREKAISKDFMTYIPGYGRVLSRKTKVWLAYDKENLYFAFMCYDDPGNIETKMSPRDSTANDDYVGVLLDSMGNKQISYEFYVNPNGIQADGLNSVVSGLDLAPDYVWDSAGKVTDEGYQVEIALPLEMFPFKSGKEVKMGIMFTRNVVRITEAGTWPEAGPGQTDHNYMTTVIYKDLKAPLKLEVLPNFTYSSGRDRVSADEWETDTTRNIGASVKYGLTSSVTAETTINPDFSQVESDALQVEVNRRYPIFFEEKRLFFLEGIGVFDFGLVNEGMMTRAVHTRHIVDPGWSGKVSGSIGKMSFAVLAANDRSQGLLLEDGVNPGAGKDVFWGIARGKYNIGSDNSLGFLYSGRYFAGAKNNVIGADLQYRFFKNIRLSLSYLSSSTKDSSGSEFKNGSGLNAMLQYSKGHFRSWAAYERYDEDFTMYSAFMNRTNFSRGILYLFRNFRMKLKWAPWIRNLQPYAQYSKLHDYATGMDDTYYKLAVNMFFVGNVFLRLEYQNKKEAWLGRLYDQTYLTSFSRVQLFKWLVLNLNLRYGEQIFYGPGEPFLGTGSEIRFRASIQPNIRFNLGLEFIQNILRRKSGDQRFYTVDILNIQGTYKFNKYFFLRGILRYDDFEKSLLTDFLASFTLIPGTVMHLGYGSLYERKMWQDDRWVPGFRGLTNLKNGLFFKVSYLYKF
ncbi:MAG: carbohydrate binding family 9 domain-containing protein [bacterium]|nr:carbohydrate binding family 9 domain-containing protein [bacterium]